MSESSPVSFPAFTASPPSAINLHIAQVGGNIPLGRLSAEGATHNPVPSTSPLAHTLSSHRTGHVSLATSWTFLATPGARSSPVALRWVDISLSDGSLPRGMQKNPVPSTSPLTHTIFSLCNAHVLDTSQFSYSQARHVWRTRRCEGVSRRICTIPAAPTERMSSYDIPK